MAIQPVKILIVDDRPDKAKALEAVLTDLGDVVKAASGKEALRLLLNQEFAVILLDVKMPGMDGFETAELIRKRETSESTPIIFVTSYDDSDISQGYSLGAVDYILAPVIPQVLRAKVSVFVDLYRKTEEVKKRAEERIQLVHEQMARASADAARKAAEEAERRAAFLANVSSLLASSLDSSHVLKDVIQLAVPQFADFCCVHIGFDPDNPRQLCSAHADETTRAVDDLLVGFSDKPDHPLRAVMATGKSLHITELGDVMLHALASDEVHYERLRSAAVKSIVVAPLTARGRTFGTLVFVTSAHSNRVLSRADVVLAEDFAYRIAVSMDNSRLYKEAQTANRMKDQFLAMVSHELRTPLTPILGWTAMIGSGKLDAGRVADGMRIIDRNVRAQTKLIDDLLDVSRIVTGKLRLNVELANLSQVISAAIESLRTAAEAKEIALEVKVEENVPAVVDQERIQQVIWNLISNAIKFTPRTGIIRVKVSSTADEAMISVSDDGKGIDPRFLPYVFDMFRQADSTTTRAFGGLGIGLAIVRHLVELHGGTVQAQSEGEGKGATFIVALPLKKLKRATPPAESDAEAPTRTADEHPLSNLRILVVDDEPDTREFIGELLEQHGAQVEEAGSAPEALTILQRFDADILISDIAMPQKDGFWLIQQVNHYFKQNGGRQMGTLAISAFARKEDRAMAVEAGYDQYLSKPIEMTALIGAVVNVANRKQISGASGSRRSQPA